jgi:hypothetical protein
LVVLLLGCNGGTAAPVRVEDCGFGAGTEGYVWMQMTMAEHQNDPLVAQYIGTAMMQILQVAGLDAAVQQQAAQAAADAK